MTKEVIEDLLHEERVFFRNASAVDHLFHLHPAFLKTLDDGERSECSGFDEGAIDLRRGGVEGLAHEESGETLVDEDGAVAVVPVQGQESALARLKF